MPLKNFLSKVGIIEEEIKVSPKKVPQMPSAAPTSFAQPTSSFAPTPVAPSVDPAIQEMLTQSLEENKLSGFDYLKFSSSVEETKAFGVPEDARYKMAFSTAKQLGVDKANLLKSGQHYLDVLSQDEADFNADCTQHDKKEIQARETKATQIEGTMTQLAKQLADLQQEHSTLKQELQSEKERLESRKVAFQATLQNFRATIESNIQKINQYL